MTRHPLRLLAAAALAGSALVAVAPGTAGAATCVAWTRTPVARGYSVLENLAFDGQGGMLLSESSAAATPGGIRRLGADGSKSTVVPNVSGPGGIVIVGRTAYFTTGNAIASGFFGLKDGTITKVDLDTGASSVVASGLVMPNGMVRLPDGDFVVSRDLGRSTAMTRVTLGQPGVPFAPAATSTNGMAVDPVRHLLYVDSTFNAKTVISAVDLDHPSAAPRTITVPGLGPLNAADDLTRGADGNLYVALNLAGKVVRVDPGTGAVCTIATGVPLVSSVRFGAGPGWDAHSLYATSFTGTVTRLTP